MAFRRTFAALASLALVTTLGTAAYAQTRTAAAAYNPESFKGVNAFACDLYGAVAAKSDNVCFAPFSVGSALAMTGRGARGDTAVEMAKALHFLPQADKRGAEYSILTKLLSATEADQGYQLSIANAVWPQKGEALAEEFVESVEKDFLGGIKPLDLSPEAPARKTINAWVAKNTADKIPELLPEGALAGARLVLTNAVYFKGKWSHPFAKEQTKDGTFTTKWGNKVTTPLMHVAAEFRYGEDETCQWVLLPYSVKKNLAYYELEMLVLLSKPKEGEGKPATGTVDPVKYGFAALEEKLSPDYVQGLLAKGTSRKVNVSLPAWKANERTELAETLQKLGMKLAFTPKADFSGIDGKGGLFISRVIHQATCEVNEEGTEAAGATAVVMPRGVARPMPPVDFVADHPFIYAIRHRSTGAILFMGRVADPTGKGK